MKESQDSGMRLGLFLNQVRAAINQCMSETYASEVSVPALIYPNRGGKALRPRLVYASALGYGCKMSWALEVATVIELFHNHALVHDDIEDSSDLRRGEPTLHHQFGVPVAVNAGVSLLAASWLKLVSLTEGIDGRIGARLIALYAKTVAKTVNGQGMELAWTRGRKSDISYAQLRQMILEKTAWYSAVFPLVSIATLAGVKDSERTRLTETGERFGLAFQLCDDLKPYLSRGEKEGKDLENDLIQGKRTLTVLLALPKLNSRDEAFLRMFLDLEDGSRKRKLLNKAMRIITSTNAVRESLDIVHEETRACLGIIDSLHLRDESQRSTLREMLTSILPA